MYNNSLAGGSASPAASTLLPAIVQHDLDEPAWLKWIKTLSPPPKPVNTPPGEPETMVDAALRWHQFGLQVIPVVPDTKQPACKWDPWLAALSPSNINLHWSRHPDHQVGAIAGPDLIVFDADTPEAEVAFNQLMKALDVSCNHIVSTSRGEHYYFRLAPGAVAKSDSHSTMKHPERLDIKTGRALVVLPPSPGKVMSLEEAESVTDLNQIDQAFVDAVYHHNGRNIPREPENRGLHNPSLELHHSRLCEINALLDHIDPDCSYDDWRTVLMAVHHESGGSDDGLALVDSWSSKGNKYPGTAKVEKKWRSFDQFGGFPVTIGSIRHLVSDAGTNPADICAEEFEVVEEDNTPSSEAHAWAKFSLRGMSSQFEAEMQDQVPILGDIAIRGQWTVLYAPPNAGKTLLTLKLVTEGIQSGKIDPEQVYYINADDNHHGLTYKLKLAEEHGFHMLAPGYQDFRADSFLDYLQTLNRNGQAKNTVVFLDTLKKFTDLMDKRRASDFGREVREFTSKGAP
ncbi:hypothetical protein BST95_19055 [Halioglobus japonicus]|uniref:PriCT-2 domain-containing protein n=1 Tax=Halioglobus japonicus TaxID=930805 RepID=UPI00097909B8|nr:PriCT-2 domain-containing protein [Halioglobus japonicus]AQA20027.1 hypothetical protein BST95_19055 [Halioglobus japonicus]